MIGYAVMSYLMTATPLAMKHHYHVFDATAFVIQWHVLAMFAPSFFTGALIQRFGLMPILLTGVILALLCTGTNLLGHTIWHFWLALVTLGISWNFLFIGGTTLLTDTYRPEEKAKAQALNDFSVYTAVTIASLFAETSNTTSAGKSSALARCRWWASFCLACFDFSERLATGELRRHPDWNPD